MMTEEFLYYIWKFRNFEFRKLTTTEGESVEIISPGERNPHSGPDFFNARIKIGSTLWAGNVEIHVRSSDWKSHLHQGDKAYDNIILHLVYEEDEKIYDQSGRLFPTIELKTKISEIIFNKYLQFKNSTSWIPCEKQFRDVSNIIRDSWLERLMVERIERKSGIILDTLTANKNNWEETFYQRLAANFGFHVNALPFEILARSLPLGLLQKYSDRILQIEALLFGQAGLLQLHFSESYPQRLQCEYQFLAHKHSLTPMDGHLWKFLRLRPSNFPTVRIAQFASLIHSTRQLFSSVLDIRSASDFKNLLNIHVSDYWESHYRFGHVSKKTRTHLGEKAMENIVVNTIVPFLFVYRKQHGIEEKTEDLLNILQHIPAENNVVIRKWRTVGILASDAARSQALLELKSRYCAPVKCLDCSIGIHLLKNS